MSHPARAAAVLLLATAVVLAPAVAPPAVAVNAVSTLEIAAQHTTDTDFNAAQELSNVSVEGSGISASITLNTQSDFEIAYRDQNNNLKFVGPSGSSPADTGEQTGDVGGVGDVDGDGDLEIAFVDNADDYVKIVDASQSTTNLGVEAYDVGGIGDIDGDGDLDVVYRDKNSNLKYVDTGGNVVDLGVDVNQPGGVGDIDDDGDLDVAYEDSGGNLKYVDDAGNSVDLNVNSDFDVGGVGDIDDDGDLDVAYESAADSDIRFVDDAGNIIDTNVGGDGVGGIGVVDTDGDLDVSFRSTGEYLKFVDSNSNTGNTSQKLLEAGGIGDIDGDGGATVGTYISQNESVGASTLAANVTAENASVNVSVEEWTGSQWQLVNFSNLTSTGNHTIDISAASNDKLRTNVEFRALTGDTTAELHDETWLFESTDPNVQNNTADPSGGEAVTSTNVNLSILITDDDFATAQGDELNVTFYDGSDDVSSQTITSNTTVSHTVTKTTGGEHSWSVTVASNNYSEVVESANNTYEVPSEVDIRNETNVTQLIDNVDVTGQFFSDEEIVINTTTDGTINLSNKPIPTEDDPLILVLEADGYHTRAVVIEDIFEQQNVYMLNDTGTVATSEIQFILDDTTGNFGTESRLLIQRPINHSDLPDNSNLTEWTTVAGDQFGEDGFTVDLETDQRLRLVLKNSVGDTRIVGPFTPTQAKTVTVQPKPLGINVTNGTESYIFNATLDNTTATPSIIVEFADPTGDTTDLEVQICEQARPNVCFGNLSASGPLGQARFNLTLNASESRKNYIVTWTADRGGGTISGQPVVGASRVEQIPTLDDRWRYSAAALVAILTGALFSQLNRETGAIVTGVSLGGFWTFGWLPANAALPIAIAIAVAVLYKTAKVQGGILPQ